MPKRRKRKPYGYNHAEKYFKEHPDEYEAYKERVRQAQKKFIAENPERWKEIQRMGGRTTKESKEQKIVEEYFG